jgi:6-pyruvoyltetrahydropterin/6-carboxytetrahydropterin synthase
LHGHEAEVHVHLVGDDLNPQGMVTDFLHLSWLKKFFDESVDHKFIIDKNDPLFNAMMSMDEGHWPDGLNFRPLLVPDTRHIAGYTLTVDSAKLGQGTDDKSLYEYYESFFIVDFIPTSENLSKWVYDLVEPKMARIGVKVGEVEWWETPKSCSRYSR